MRSMLYWYYQEERGTGMAYAKAIELNSDGNDSTRLGSTDS